MTDSLTKKGDTLVQKEINLIDVQYNVHEILCAENPQCTCGHRYLSHYKKVNEILLSFCCVTNCECLQFVNADEERENLKRFLKNSEE